jgi:hypothetical protein
MIRVHEFNTRWAGAPVGIVDDPGFFALPAVEREAALARFRWVEFKSRFGDAPPLRTLMRAGFFLADTQIPFQIALPPPANGTSGRALEMLFADESPFQLREDEVRSFTHERYQHVPGLGVPEIDRRYTGWARQLMREHPETCIQARVDGTVQGWFLAEPGEAGLHLTLAMLHRNARLSGFQLYKQSLIAYAARGHRQGCASFSVRNAAVLNIYARLGAHFLEPTGIWLWVAEA